MSYVISTSISGITHCLKPDQDSGKFILIPVKTASDVARAFNAPQKTIAIQILNWVQKNDTNLSSHSFEVSASSKFG
jgi:hypothetical protein